MPVISCAILGCSVVAGSFETFKTEADEFFGTGFDVLDLGLGLGGVVLLETDFE